MIQTIEGTGIWIPSVVIKQPFLVFMAGDKKMQAIKRQWLPKQINLTVRIQFSSDPVETVARGGQRV